MSLPAIVVFATLTATSTAKFNWTADKPAYNWTVKPLPRKPANVSEAKSMLDQAAHILSDELAAWKLMLHGGGDYVIGAAPNNSSPLCSGPSCVRVSELLPQLQFKTKKAVVQCSEADFKAGACFAPGCAQCSADCPIFQTAPFLLTKPGPFGTGLFCNGCQPCCQRATDPNRALNSTCVLV